MQIVLHSQFRTHVIVYDKNDRYSRVFDVLGIPPCQW